MTDEAIMEAVKNGDLGQTSVLFERYHVRIYRFLIRMTMNGDDAQDLTQNVFLRIIRYRTSYKPELKFQSWIYQMARNAFADHYRSHQSKSARFTDVEKISDHLPDAADHEDQDHREHLLRLSMERLDPEQKELLVLTRYEKLPYEEVAEMLDTTTANIKVRVHRAIGKLREHYFELEGKPI